MKNNARTHILWAFFKAVDGVLAAAEEHRGLAFVLGFGVGIITGRGIG